MTVLWQKALRFEQDARRLHDSESYDSACSRAYYAIFSAARTLLEMRGHGRAAAKTHPTILRLFSSEFVQSGIFAPELGRTLKRAGNNRLIADYDDAAYIDRAEAANTLDLMNAFMRAADAYIASIRVTE